MDLKAGLKFKHVIKSWRTSQTVLKSINRNLNRFVIWIKLPYILSATRLHSKGPPSADTAANQMSQTPNAQSDRQAENVSDWLVFLIP